MIPRNSKLPHERPEARADWEENYGTFTTIDDEIAKRYHEAHKKLKDFDDDADESDK